MSSSRHDLAQHCIASSCAIRAALLALFPGYGPWERAYKDESGQHRATLEAHSWVPGLTNIFLLVGSWAMDGPLIGADRYSIIFPKIYQVGRHVHVFTSASFTFHQDSNSTVPTNALSTRDRLAIDLSDTCAFVLAVIVVTAIREQTTLTMQGE